MYYLQPLALRFRQSLVVRNFRDNDSHTIAESFCNLVERRVCIFDSIVQQSCRKDDRIVNLGFLDQYIRHTCKKFDFL